MYLSENSSLDPDIKLAVRTHTFKQYLPIELSIMITWALMRGNLTLLHLTQRCTDQSAHLHSLISAFVNSFFFERIITPLAMRKKQPSNVSKFSKVLFLHFFSA